MSSGGSSSGGGDSFKDSKGNEYKTYRENSAGTKFGERGTKPLDHDVKVKDSDGKVRDANWSDYIFK